MEEIKFVDLGRQYQEIKEEVNVEINKVLEKGDFILGNSVKLFEEEFSKFCGTKFAVGVDNGTTALELALKVLNIGKDDEVITVSNTFIATTLAISAVEGKVVLTDIDEETMLMDTALIEPLINEKTKAIIPVHLYGQMVDMEKVMELANKYNLYVIEDCSQSHGATQNGQECGTFGHINCFSLYPGKNLGAYGDAGVIVTNEEQYYNSLIKIRNYGSSVKYYHDFLGKNARLDTLQAAVLNVKIKYLNDWNKKRNHVANKYFELLKNIPEIKLPKINEINYSVFHLFVIKTNYRDELMDYLNNFKIPTVIHYPIPIHLQKAYTNLGFKKGDFPITEKIADQIISLPIHPNLYDEEIEFIANKINDFFQEKLNN